MNRCDYDHETKGETRLLPIGGSGNIICCYKHYRDEMTYRKERNHEIGKLPQNVQESTEREGKYLTDEMAQFINGIKDSLFDIPSWDSLKVYAEAVK